MIIRVAMKDGKQRKIDLVEPVVVHDGQLLNSFRGGNGIDHFFTPDGYYDGFGMACNVPMQQLPPEDLPCLLRRLADIAEGEVRLLADIDRDLAGEGSGEPG